MLLKVVDDSWEITKTNSSCVIRAELKWLKNRVIEFSLSSWWEADNDENFCEYFYETIANLPHCYNCKAREQGWIEIFYRNIWWIWFSGLRHFLISLFNWQPIKIDLHTISWCLSSALFFSFTLLETNFFFRSIKLLLKIFRQFLLFHFLCPRKFSVVIIFTSVSNGAHFSIKIILN